MAQTLNKVNVFLLALAITLGALLWWAPSTSNQTMGETLTQLSVDQIETITIQGRDNEPFTLAHRHQQWWLTGSRELPADPQKIDALMALLKAPVYDRFSRSTSGTGDQFITAEHNQWVRFNQLEIRFGQSHPLGQRRYLSINNEIALVDDFYYHHLLSQPVDWVSHQLIPPGVTLSRIALPELTLTLENGRWQSAPTAASADQINQLVSRWQNLFAAKITELVDDDAVSDLPQVTLEWQGTPAAPETLTLHLRTFNDEKQLVNRQQRVAYHLNSATADALFQLPAENH